MKAEFLRPKIKGDKIIWTIYLILSIVSLIFVFTSIGRVTYRINGDITFLLLKHAGIICLGIFATYIASRIKYDNYGKRTNVFYVIFAVVFMITRKKMSVYAD
jgi:cell division protein FtsW